MADIYSTDIVDLVPAVNEAIIIDNLTIIRDPDTGALVAVPPAPSSYESPPNSYVAPHQHVSIDITDFLESVRASLGPGEADQPFFANTAVSNAVVFTYDDATKTVSADVKIDNLTITKNEYGQLVASGIPEGWTPDYVAPHVHVSTDITNFILDVRAALGPGDTDQPFFANTATSNAVVFTYDTALKTVSADVKIDNLTIIKNEYGQLVAAPQTPIDPDYVAPHTHPSADITDFQASTRAALGPGADNKPFFINTAITNAVVFAYDNNLKTVSADVKIDNNTIVKNKYGQIAAVKQLVLAEDIAGLPELIESYVVDAELQVLRATAPNGDTWVPSGYHNFVNVTIGDALYELNKDSKHLYELEGKFESILPPPPAYISSATILDIDPEVEHISVLEAGTGNSIMLAINSMPYTSPTDRLYKGSTNSGFLTALIDGENKGRLDPLDPDFSQQGAINGALIITEDVDAYVDELVFHGLYRSIRAKIAPTDPLDTGKHLYQLQHTIPGVGDYYSSILEVCTDTPATTMSINPTGFDSIPAIRYISGVPSLDPDHEIILSSTIVKGVVGYSYGTKVAALSGEPALQEAIDIPAAAIPPAPDYLDGQYGDAVIAPTTFYLQNTYIEDISVTLTPYNNIGTAGTARTFHLGRIDPTTEVERVYSGDPTTLYPTTGGTVWDSSLSLLVERFGELQKLNSVYRWPTGNYTISSDYLISEGPDYTDAPGVAVDGVPGTWRWVTFKLPEIVVNKVAYTIQFNGGNTADWVADPFTRVTEDILIYTKIGPSGWVNANAPYPGAGVADTNGAPAMDASRSTAISKRVTYGPSTINSTPGNIYVRIGLPLNSSKQFSGITVSEWA